MAPGLPKGRFSHPKYHDHACQLAKIIKTVLLFTYTDAILDALQEQIINWVQMYEK
jgi:hypothetical protein